MSFHVRNRVLRLRKFHDPDSVFSGTHVIGSSRHALIPEGHVGISLSRAPGDPPCFIDGIGMAAARPGWTEVGQNAVLPEEAVVDPTLSARRGPRTNDLAAVVEGAREGIAAQCTEVDGLISR